MRRRRVVAGLAIVAIGAVGAALGVALGTSSSTRTHTLIATATVTQPTRTITKVRPIQRMPGTPAQVKRAIVPGPAARARSTPARRRSVPARVATSVGGLPRWSPGECGATYQKFATHKPALLGTYRHLLDLQYGCHL